MKTVGIAMLFGLCCLIGIRIGTRKTAAFGKVRSLRSDLSLFSEQIGTGGTLSEIAGRLDGTLSSILRIYLDMLDKGRSESDAVDHASEILAGCGHTRDEVRSFLNGLSNAGRSDLKKRTEMLMPLLERAESEAEKEAKRARVLQISGVLTGAGLAVLLM